MTHRFLLIFRKFILAFMLVLPLGFCGLGLTAVAQELSPNHLALAKRYVELTDRAQIYEIVLLETGIHTMRTIVGTNPEIVDQISNSIGVVIEHYADRKDELFDQFARVYALRFTEAELVEIVAFYETDVGDKLAEQSALANNELQAVMRVFETNLSTEFYAKVRAELRDLEIEI